MKTPDQIAEQQGTCHADLITRAAAKIETQLLRERVGDEVKVAFSWDELPLIAQDLLKRHLGRYGWSCNVRPLMQFGIWEGYLVTVYPATEAP